MAGGDRRKTMTKIQAEALLNATPDPFIPINQSKVPGVEDVKAMTVGQARARNHRKNVAAGDAVSPCDISLGYGTERQIRDADRFSDEFELQQRKDAFVQYMLTGQSWSEAATSVGVTKAVAAKWLKSKKLRARLSKCRDILAEQGLTRLATLVNSAVTVIQDAMGSKNKMTTRLAAAKMLFDSFGRLNSMVGLESRLRDIEESLGVTGALPHHFNQTNLAQITQDAFATIAESPKRIDVDLDLDLDLGVPDDSERPVSPA